MCQYMGQIMFHLGAHHTPQLKILHVLMQQNNYPKGDHYHAIHISFSFTCFNFTCTPCMHIFWPHTCIPLHENYLSLHAYIFPSCNGKTVSCSKLCSSCSKLHALRCMWRRPLNFFLLMVTFGTSCSWHWVSICTFYSLEMLFYPSWLL